MFYYFDNIIEIESLGFDKMLLDEKSYKNNLAYDILYKTLIGVKTLHISFDKVDGFISL